MFAQTFPNPTTFQTYTQTTTIGNFNGQLTCQPRIIKTVYDKDGKVIETVELKP